GLEDEVGRVPVPGHEALEVAAVPGLDLLVEHGSYPRLGSARRSGLLPGPRPGETGHAGENEGNCDRGPHFKNCRRRTTPPAPARAGTYRWGCPPRSPPPGASMRSACRRIGPASGRP